MGRFLQKLSIDATLYGAAAAFTVDVLNFGRFGADRGCYSPSDVSDAQQEFGANCGQASFSAICRSPIVDSMRFFPQFPDRDWTTIGDMRKALRAANTEFVD